MTPFGFDTATLDCKLIVQRVATGSTPYGWEVRGADGITLVYVSTDRFRSMEAAYKAGKAWLATQPGRRKPGENVVPGLRPSRGGNSSIDRGWRSVPKAPGTIVGWARE